MDTEIREREQAEFENDRVVDTDESRGEGCPATGKGERRSRDVTEFFVANFHPSCHRVSLQLRHVVEVRLEIVTVNVFAAAQLVPSPKSEKTVCLPKACTQGRPDFCGRCTVSKLGSSYSTFDVQYDVCCRRRVETIPFFPRS